MCGRRWTATEDRLARELAADGYTLADVAAELGRGPKAAKQRLHRLGVSLGRHGPQPDPVREAEVLALLAAGLSCREIARRSGQHHGTVGLVARRLARKGLVARDGRGRGSRWHTTAAWTRAGREDGREEATGLAADGLAAREIAARLGVCRHTVLEWLRR